MKVVYPHGEETSVAIVEQWITCGGRNTSADVAHVLALDSDRKIVADILDAWKFKHPPTREDLTAAVKAWRAREGGE